MRAPCPLLLLAFTATASAFNLGGARIISHARSPARAATSLDETILERTLEVRSTPRLRRVHELGTARRRTPPPACDALRQRPTPLPLQATPVSRCAGYARGGGGRQPVDV